MEFRSIPPYTKRIILLNILYFVVSYDDGEAIVDVGCQVYHKHFSFFIPGARQEKLMMILGLNEIIHQLSMGYGKQCSSVWSCVEGGLSCLEIGI